jgi:hypothetical protein
MGAPPLAASSSSFDGSTNTPSPPQAAAGGSQMDRMKAWDLPLPQDWVREVREKRAHTL